MKVNCLFFFLIFISCSKAKLGSIIEDHSQILQVIDSDLMLPISFLKEIKFDILLSGEAHGIVENYTIRKSLIRHLVKERGIKYLLIEFPLSTSRLLQHYINTGDEADLLFIYNNLKSTSEYTQESIDFFRWIRTFNNSLAIDKKLQIIGVDIEHQPVVTKYYISKLISNKTIPLEIDKNIQRLLKENYTFELLTSVDKDILLKENFYKQLFNKDFDDFKLIIKNALVRFQYGSNSTLFNEAREKAMLETWIQLTPIWGNNPVYGHFGDAHLVTYSLSYDRLALLLKKNSVTKSLVSQYIPFIYNNSILRNAQGVQVPFDALDSQEWKNQVKEKYYFYDFSNLPVKNAKKLGWPFTKELFGSPPSGIFTDYFKYFLLINQGTACTTFKG